MVITGPAALETPRLRLVPADARHASAPDRAALEALLGAALPVLWPPQPEAAAAFAQMEQQLRDDPSLAGWLFWFVLDPAARTVVGSVDLKGRPDTEGIVELGYGFTPARWGEGLATEAAGALLRWVLAQPGVKRVVAETRPENGASQRVLAKLGFEPAGKGVREGHQKYEFRP